MFRVAVFRLSPSYHHIRSYGSFGEKPLNFSVSLQVFKNPPFDLHSPVHFRGQQQTLIINNRVGFSGFEAVLRTPQPLIVLW